jgi:hypothetical protein
MCCPRNVPPANQGPGAPGGAFPGGQSPAERRAGNLLKYMEKICARLGLTDGAIWTKMHDGRPGPVSFSDESTFDAEKGPPPPPQVWRGTGGNARSYTPQAYYPKMIKWLLRNRLRRLLKHCNLLHGPILFELKKGKIVIHPTDVFRPKMDGIDKLARWFSNDPP